LTVLVTGAGALVGQGVLRALRMSGRAMRIVTGDPDHRATGHWLGDAAHRIPMAADPQFIERVEDVITREDVSVVLVGTDAELGVFSQARALLEAKHGVQIVVSSPRVVEIADDKWKTVEFLRENRFPYPRSAISEDRGAVDKIVRDVGFPLFAKPRRGARSKGAGVIHSAQELDAIYRTRAAYIIEELLPDHDGEFTAGCLVADGCCASVTVLRRDLRDGNTYRAYSEGASGFESCIAAIAERLGPHGPCNLQFRVRNGEPVVFEINARFSGTTPIRGIFGYNEVDGFLDYLVDGTPIPAASLRQGVVLRAWSDVFVPAEQMHQFADRGCLEKPDPEPFPFR
jgi:carbamoyl-phosphate synthase large subunit